MEIKECAYCSKDTIWGFPSKGSCNLFPETYNTVGNYRFNLCEEIPISKCPYKLFSLGKIDKEELNKRICNAI